MSDTKYYCTCGHHHDCDKKIRGHCIHASSSERCQDCKDKCGRPTCYCTNILPPIDIKNARLVYCSKTACFNSGVLIQDGVILCESCSNKDKSHSIFGCTICANTLQKYYVLQTKKLICTTCKERLSS